MHPEPGARGCRRSFEREQEKIPQHPRKEFKEGRMGALKGPGKRSRKQTQNKFSPPGGRIKGQEGKLGLGKQFQVRLQEKVLSLLVTTKGQEIP